MIIVPNCRLHISRCVQKPLEKSSNDKPTLKNTESGGAYRREVCLQLFLISFIRDDSRLGVEAHVAEVLEVSRLPDHLLSESEEEQVKIRSRKQFKVVGAFVSLCFCMEVSK